jgi:hypothetical protein
VRSGRVQLLRWSFKHWQASERRLRPLFLCCIMYLLARDFDICVTGLFFRNGIGRLSVLTEGNMFAGVPVVSNDEIVAYWRGVCFGTRMKSNDVA